jgi:hypothetical protein
MKQTATDLKAEAARSRQKTMEKYTQATELPAMDEDMKVSCFRDSFTGLFCAIFRVHGEIRMSRYGDTEQEALEWLIGDVVSRNMLDESNLRRGKALAAYLEARLAALPEEGGSQ